MSLEIEPAGDPSSQRRARGAYFGVLALFFWFAAVVAAAGSSALLFVAFSCAQVAASATASGWSIRVLLDTETRDADRLFMLAWLLWSGFWTLIEPFWAWFLWLATHFVG